MKNFIVDHLVSNLVFDFTKYNYGVAHERVTSSWLERLMGRNKERDRFWIYRTAKYKLDGKLPDVLFRYTSSNGFAFFPPNDGPYHSEKRKIVYWGDMKTPVDIIEGVKARLDSGSLLDHTVFNTKDLKW